MGVNNELLVHHLGLLERMTVRRNRSAIVMGFVALLFFVWERSPGVVIKLSMVGEISDVTVGHMIVLGPLILSALLIWVLIHSYRVRKITEQIKHQIEHLDPLDIQVTNLVLNDFADYKQIRYKDVYWWVNVPIRVFFFFIIPVIATLQILNSYSTFHPQFIRHEVHGYIDVIEWESTNNGGNVLGPNKQWDIEKYGKSPYNWSHWEKIKYLYFNDISSKGAKGLLRRSDIEKNKIIVETFPYVSTPLSWFHFLVNMLNIYLAFHLMRIQINLGRKRMIINNDQSQCEEL